MKSIKEILQSKVKTGVQKQSILDNSSSENSEEKGLLPPSANEYRKGFPILAFVDEKKLVDLLNSKTNNTLAFARMNEYYGFYHRDSDEVVIIWLDKAPPPTEKEIRAPELLKMLQNDKRNRAILESDATIVRMEKQARIVWGKPPPNFEYAEKGYYNIF